MFEIAQVLLLAKLILVVLVFDPRSFDTFSLPKSVAAHTMTLLLAALMVSLVARHGWRVFIWSSAHTGAGLLLVAFALATPFALDPTLGLFGVFKRYLGFTQMLDNVLLYVAVGVLYRSARSLRLLAIVTMATAVPVLVYALVQRLGGDPFQFQQATTTIPISTLGNPDLAGAYVAIAGITAFGLAFLLWDRVARAYAIGLVAIGIACVGILAVTGVRAGALGVGAGWIAIVLLAFSFPGYRRGHRWATLILGAVLALGVVLSPISSRVGSAILGNDAATQSRLEIWGTAWKAIGARPLLGLGPDNFAAYYPANRAESSAFISAGELQTSTHDVWLYIGTSAGLVGLGAFALFVVLLAVLGIRAARRGDIAALALIPLFAYLGTSLVTVNEVVVDWPFWLSAGVIASAGAQPLLPKRSSRGLAEPKYRTAFGVLMLAAALALIVFTEVPRVISSEAMLASEAYSGANRGAEAVVYGERAVSSDARRAEHWSTYGTDLFTSDRPVAAAAAFAKAAMLQPWQPLNWRNLAIAWGALGNSMATRAASARAVAVDPYDPVSHALLSSVAYDQGDFTLAANEGERGLALTASPTSGMYFITVSAYVQLKQLERAEPVARRAVAAFPTIPLRLQLAAILADRGERLEAVALLDAVLKDAPDNVDAQRLRAAIVKP